MDDAYITVTSNNGNKLKEFGLIAESMGWELIGEYDVDYYKSLCFNISDRYNSALPINHMWSCHVGAREVTDYKIDDPLLFKMAIFKISKEGIYLNKKIEDL